MQWDYDHFDTAEGYRGRNQYLIAVQSFKTDLRPGATGAVSAEQSAFEADGCGSTSGTCPQGYNSVPFSMPVFANFTFIGPGKDVFQQAGNGWDARAAGDNGLGANIRRGTGGVWSWACQPSAGLPARQSGPYEKKLPVWLTTMSCTR